jgi:pimeloyl-ACP methyl ester carboxylesterase
VSAALGSIFRFRVEEKNVLNHLILWRGMCMPYATNQGVRIHYQVEGDGAPLVLLHGFNSNLANWYERGYVEPLRCDYRLILIDARGHGASDKPHDRAAYTWPIPVADVIAVLDHLHIPQAHVLGYSMGGGACFGLAKYAPTRVMSLLIGGIPAQEDSFATFEGVDGTDPESFFAAYEAKLGVRLPPDRKARMATNDLQALAAAAQTRPSLEEVLPQMTMPCLLFVGEADPWSPLVQDNARRIPKATVVSFPGLGHAEVSRRADLVLPQVTQFLRAVTAGSV